MKKIFKLVIIVVVVLLVFKACGGSKSERPDQTNSTVSSQSELNIDEFESDMDMAIDTPADAQTEENNNELGDTKEDAENIDVQTNTEASNDQTIKDDTDEENNSADAGISPEFKEAMDSYEAFFDEYIEFMEKYSEADDVTSMLLDYANYMNQYVETMEKMNAINQEELTPEEALYYAEVSARISQKLIRVAQ